MGSLEGAPCDSKGVPFWGVLCALRLQVWTPSGQAVGAAKRSELLRFVKVGSKARGGFNM